MGNKLLVVDSDPKVHQWLENNLPAEGYEVTCYQDGLSALDMLSSENPDLVLADYNLVGINIFRFCDKLKQKSADKSRPTFILVRPEDETDTARLNTLGVTELIEKPLHLDVILQKIREHSGRVESQVPEDSPSPALDSPTPKEESPQVQPETGSEGSAQPGQSEEQMEDPKLEELLGWSLPSDRKGEAPSPDAAVPEPASADQPVVEENQTAVMDSVGMDTPMGSGGLSDTVLNEESVQAPSASLDDSAEEPTVVISLADSMHGSPEDQGIQSIETENETSITTEQPSHTSESSVPTPMQETPSPQEEKPSTSINASQETIEASVPAIAREIIEKVAWEVVPAIAEALIKEELEKIKSEDSK